MNTQIRDAIMQYIQTKGPQNTRHIISLFSSKYHTSKQRVSGNLSFMKRMNIIKILPNKPRSIMY